jgi:hypothetical protein
MALADRPDARGVPVLRITPVGPRSRSQRFWISEHDATSRRVVPNCPRVVRHAASLGRLANGSRGDRTGRAVAIREQGWSVVDRPDVHFRRPDDLLPLPVPARDGSIELLRSYVNLTDSDFRLMIAWLTAAMRPVGPYPILVLNGDQNSGKSTLAMILEWGEATGRALGWGADTFLAIYNENRKDATEMLLEDSRVAAVLLTISRHALTLGEQTRYAHWTKRLRRGMGGAAFASREAG